MAFSSRLSILLVLLLLGAKAAAPATAPNKEDALKQRYSFICHWTGPHGVGTAILISPSWILTAGHVAGPKADDPSRKIHITFDDGQKTTVDRAAIAPAGDVALAHLADPVNLPPAHLFSSSFSRQDGEITFTLAGHSGGLHIHPGRHGHAEDERHFHHSTTKQDPSPGKAGDSGGAWALDNDDLQSPIVFAVIHGSGAGTQLAPLRNWIDSTLNTTHEAPRWETGKKPAGSSRGN